MSDPANIIDSATASTILKWAIGILITGFIAQFGKKFANYLMDKTRSLRKGRKQEGDDNVHGESARGDTQIHARDQFVAASQAAAEKARLKLEKKKSKNRIKERKK